MGSLKLQIIRLLAFFAVPQLSEEAGGNKMVWCCRGWSDDLSKSGVDTVQDDGLCAGTRSCTDSTESDCATGWYSTLPFENAHKTADDCSDLKTVNETCYCDNDWCNCPKSLRGVQTPPLEESLTCCSGEIKDMSHITTGKCGRSSACGQTISKNFTQWSCMASRGQRLRADCFQPSLKEFPGNYFSQACRCTTNRCNCPPELKNKGGRVGFNSQLFNSQINFLVLTLLFCNNFIIFSSKH